MLGLKACAAIPDKFLILTVSYFWLVVYWFERSLVSKANLDGLEIGYYIAQDGLKLAM